MMRSTNPALNAKVFNNARSFGVGEPMTIQGTVNKSFILVFLLLLSASWVWNKAFQSTAMGVESYGLETATSLVNVSPFIFGGLIAGLVFAMITIFKKEWAGVTAPAYALCEGLALGGISAYYEAQFNGIVFQAVALTSGTLICLLMAYKSGLIKATENFKLGIVAATGSICLLYIVNMIMGFFGGSIPLIHSNGTFGIIFSLVVVTIAALNLVIDFDFIEQGAEMKVPKYMEWYGAFGLMVTLVWLYLEILRLLAKLNSRR